MPTARSNRPANPHPRCTSISLSSIAFTPRRPSTTTRTRRRPDRHLSDSETTHDGPADDSPADDDISTWARVTTPAGARPPFAPLHPSEH